LLPIIPFRESFPVKDKRGRERWFTLEIGKNGSTKPHTLWVCVREGREPRPFEECWLLFRVQRKPGEKAWHSDDDGPFPTFTFSVPELERGQGLATAIWRYLEESVFGKAMALSRVHGFLGDGDSTEEQLDCLAKFYSSLGFSVNRRKREISKAYAR
jgi:hypothetical protein